MARRRIFTVKRSGDWEGLVEWHHKFLSDADILKVNSKVRRILDRYGRRGVLELTFSTPRDTGTTAASWSYDISILNDHEIRLGWYNSNVVYGRNDKYCVAVLIQYGHGTRNGGYVRGVDYINPALKPIFHNIVEEINEVFKQ